VFVDEDEGSDSESPVDEDEGSDSESPVDEDEGSDSESPVDEDEGVVVDEVNNEYPTLDKLQLHEIKNNKIKTKIVDFIYYTLRKIVHFLCK
jgi:hypothetical protein